MTRRVVGLMVLPAAPDDADPGTREDARGVRMGLVRMAVASVQLLRPRAGAHGVLRKVDQGVAQLFVARPAEGDQAMLAGGARRRYGTSQSGERLGRREARAAVADLDQQGGSAHRARPWQAAENGAIG